MVASLLYIKEERPLLANFQNFSNCPLRPLL